MQLVKLDALDCISIRDPTVAPVPIVKHNKSAALENTAIDSGLVTYRMLSARGVPSEGICGSLYAEVV